MFTNPRRQRYTKKRIIVFVFLIGALAILIFLFNTFSFLGKPLFVSPVGKENTDINLVKKILKDNKVLFSDVSLLDDTYLVSLQSNGQVKLSQNKDINKQVASLQRILIQLTIEGKSFKNIDFRFSEPIIAF